MHDDDLKKVYQEQSNEQPPAALDKAILQQAKEAVSNNQQQKRAYRGWQPKLATAASVFLVVLLAVQFKPLYFNNDSFNEESFDKEVSEEKDWDSNIQPITAPATTAPDKTKQLQRAPAEGAMSFEVAEQDALQASSTEPEVVSEMSEQLATEQATVAKKSKVVQQELRRRAEMIKEEQKLDDDIATLRSIQQLLKDGQINEAQIKWQSIKAKYPTAPQSEPLKSLYLGLEPVFK